MGMGICDWQQWYSISNSDIGDTSTLHHEQTIFGEEIHTLITFMVSVMTRGVPMWEFWVLPMPIIFLSKSTDTDHQSNIDLAYVKQ